MNTINRYTRSSPNTENMRVLSELPSATSNRSPPQNPCTHLGIQQLPDIPTADLNIIRNFLSNEQRQDPLNRPSAFPYYPPGNQVNLNTNPLVNNLLMNNLSSLANRHNKLSADNTCRQLQNLASQRRYDSACQRQIIYERRLKLLELSSLLLGCTSFALLMSLLIYALICAPSDFIQQIWTYSINCGIAMAGCLLINLTSSLIRHNLPKLIKLPLHDPVPILDPHIEEESAQNLQQLSTVINRSGALLRREHLLDFLEAPAH